jgi:hypothetical protein
MKPKLFAAFVALSCVTFGTAPSLADVLQVSAGQIGNQVYSGVGIEFQVNSAITVSGLGIYDSGQDGIAASSPPLSAYLFTGTGIVEASSTFSHSDPGTLDPASGGYRFKSISPLTLTPGLYVLAGYGWSSSDPEHNSNVNGTPDTFNTAGGALTYIGSPFGGGNDPAGTFPTVTCCGNIDFFSAANIEFNVAAVPEPSTWLMMILGFACVGLVAARKAKPGLQTA